MTTLTIEQWGMVDYAHAQRLQLALVKQRQCNPDIPDVCVLLQHPTVFTLGRHGRESHLNVSASFLAEKKIKLVRVQRGGEVTCHGPGQLVCYPVINLRRRGLGVAAFIHKLEQIMLDVTRQFGLQTHRDDRNHGIWLKEKKLGSVGIAIRHGISYHGLALNVAMDLEPFNWINPCGLTGISMGSMHEALQNPPNFTQVEQVMITTLNQHFSQETEQQPSKRSSQRRPAKPAWLKQRLPRAGYEQTRRLVRNNKLCTVCQEARCPNQFECFARGTATFMLMGESCTRNCRFCAISHKGPLPLDPDEPDRIADAVATMGLGYCVLTSVTRDDLADGGADHFAKTMIAIKNKCPDTLIEVLIPDLQGNRAALAHICSHHPAVLNHNIETVAALYPLVRPQAIYQRSLALLQQVKEIDPAIITKSGLMLGLGETEEELLQTITDIRSTGCNLLTLGQYLQPTTEHYPVEQYVPPDKFATLRADALQLGFAGVAAGPRVRSSYQADELHAQAQATM